ncbi:DNA-binding transcriptional regulator, LysR family [Rhizobium mongolense subsp. loessense]|uniref:HTH-type transcriptional regulator TtuA n=1 Tax=Rhizobium mongolense subsp. loessense TaxID=158890 RepID=A0A1G4Q0H7_9HYPH|nr:LysR substrate-binding domain-containing protein [Rhizobium mongolense]SCW37828.1 DNA-binding transcriptional regulator, LysR family [Rhizobium mongolense subsp. loessense]
MNSFNLNDLNLFVHAVEGGSFTAAGRRLGVPKSTVSKRVAELEAKLGARLIQRTSRSFSLTDLGRDFFEHAQASVIEAEMAESIVRSRLGEPNGTVRITASVPASQFMLAEHLPDLAVRYPKLKVFLHVTDRFVDIVQEGFDIALRSHQLPLADSSLVQRKLAEHEFLLVAAPSYVDRHGAPQRPEDLVAHAAVMPSLTETAWRLFSAAGDETLVKPPPVMAADEPFVLLRAAAAGMGITILPTSVCREAIEQGRLIRILPEWTAGNITTTVLLPHRRGQLPSVRAVVDFISERLGQP